MEASGFTFVTLDFLARFGSAVLSAEACSSSDSEASAFVPVFTTELSGDLFLGRFPFGCWAGGLSVGLSVVTSSEPSKVLLGA